MFKEAIILLALYVTVLHAASSGVRLQGYPNYHVFAKSYVSWNRARSKCQSLGGDLVSFETEKEWLNVGAALIKYFKNKRFYIGGRGDGKGNYRWANNDVIISKANKAWYEDLNCTGCEHIEPNYGGGSRVCVQMKTWRSLDSNWFDDPCFWKSNFICEL